VQGQVEATRVELNYGKMTKDGGEQS